MGKSRMHWVDKNTVRILDSTAERAREEVIVLFVNVAKNPNDKQIHAYLAQEAFHDARERPGFR